MTPPKEQATITYETVRSATFEDRIAEIDAQLRSISLISKKTVMQCDELRDIFLAAAKRGPSRN